MERLKQTRDGAGRANWKERKKDAAGHILFLPAPHRRIGIKWERLVVERVRWRRKERRVVEVDERAGVGWGCVVCLEAAAAKEREVGMLRETRRQSSILEVSIGGRWFFPAGNCSLFFWTLAC